MSDSKYRLIPQNIPASAPIIKLIRETTNQPIGTIRQQLISNGAIMVCDEFDDEACVKMSLLYKRLKKLSGKCKILLDDEEESIEMLDAGINFSKEISVEVGSDLFEKDEWWWNVDLDDVE